MPFAPKDWRDSPGDLTTPITAAALENLESRTTAGIPYENVLWHGAVGNNTGDQTAAIQAAIDACETGGGTVFIPRGTYRLLGGLEMHDDVSILGEGPVASILSWPTSTGAGTWAIRPSGIDSARHTTISDLGLVGPGTWDGATFGGNVSDMNGLWIGAGQVVNRCQIGFFHRGCGILEDHSQICFSSFSANTYNLAWLPGEFGGGDHHIYSTTLTGATIASVYVENTFGLAGGTFNGTHFGLAPYGILSAPGRAGTNFIFGVTFLNSHFEWFGTAAIWGSNTTDKILGANWINTYSSHEPGALLPATTYEFVVRAGEISGCVFDMNAFAPPQEPGTAYFSTSGVGGQQSDRYEMVPSVAIESNTAAFLHRTAGGESAFCSFVDQLGTSGRFCACGAAVTKGQLVRYEGNNSCRLYDGAFPAEVPIGVALQSGATGAIIAVATQGYTNLLVADGTIATSRFLKPASTSGRVVEATGWSDGPIVGVSMSAATIGVALHAHLRMGTWG